MELLRALCIYAAVSRKYYCNIVIIFSRRTCNTLARLGVFSLRGKLRNDTQPPASRIDIAKRQHFPAPRARPRSLVRPPALIFVAARELYLFLNTIDIFTVSLLFSALSSLCENKVLRRSPPPRKRSADAARLGDPLIHPTPVVHAYFSTCRHCKTRTLYDANKSRELSRLSTFALATRQRQRR